MIRRAVTAALVPAALLGMAACAAPEDRGLGSDTDVKISGTVLDAGGAPTGDAYVRIRKGLLDTELPDERLRLLHDLGLACIDAGAPKVCGKVDRAKWTDGDGRFRVEMEGHDTTSGGMEPLRRFLDAAAQAPPRDDEVSGPAAGARFTATSTDVSLPTLQLWRPTVTVEGLRVRWTPLPPALGRPELYLVVVEDRRGGLLWASEATAPDLTLDPAVPAAGPGTISVVALATQAQPDAVLTYRSPRWAVRIDATPGVSGGAACVELGRPCPLTDGDLGNEVVAGRDATSPVDLGSARPVSAVVVRGCFLHCLVEASADGATWGTLGPVERPAPLGVPKPVGESYGPVESMATEDRSVGWIVAGRAYRPPHDGIARSPGGVAARFLRVVRVPSTERPRYYDLRLREVTVHSGPPTASIDLVDPRSAGIARLRLPPRPLPRWLVTIAIAALVLLMVALALVWSRRRRERRAPSAVARHPHALSTLAAVVLQVGLGGLAAFLSAYVFSGLLTTDTSDFEHWLLLLLVPEALIGGGIAFLVLRLALRTVRREEAARRRAVAVYLVIGAVPPLLGLTQLFPTETHGYQWGPLWSGLLTGLVPLTVAVLLALPSTRADFRRVTSPEAR